MGRCEADRELFMASYCMGVTTTLEIFGLVEAMPMLFWTKFDYADLIFAKLEHERLIWAKD
jgi:hypothetical protein